MRIVSSFHDYYDCVQSQGQDQTLVYVRQPREARLPGEFPFLDLLRSRYFGDNLLRAVYIVGLCGKVYPVLDIQLPRADTHALCHTLQDVDNFVTANFKPSLVECYFSKKQKGYWSEPWRQLRHDQFERFFDEAATAQGKFDYLFRENYCPVFKTKDSTIVFNARLKDLEFYRVVDPYTAFQEIQMFLGGMASPEKPIPKIDDKTLAQAKGFDKWSFRKAPNEPTHKR